VRNEHPDARCDKCFGVKPCVAWEACSEPCAMILGVSRKGLPSREIREHEWLRADGVVKGPFGSFGRKFRDY
jgi:hypothetical protein